MFIFHCDRGRLHLKGGDLEKYVKCAFNWTLIYLCGDILSIIGPVGTVQRD